MESRALETMMRLWGWRKSEAERREELLSAYLDGELGEREREQLEARLSKDADLREELRALSHVATVVRELPRVAAPRNFILSDSMVSRQETAPAPEPRRAWAAPLLTAATAVSSLLFAVVVAGQLMLPGLTDFAAAPEMVGPMEEAAPMVVDDYPMPEAERDVVGPTPDSEVVPEVLREGLTLEVEEEPEALVVPTESEPVEEESGLTATIPAEEPVGPERQVEVAEPTPVEIDVTPPPVREERVLSRALLSRRVVEIALGLATLGLAIATVQAWRVRLS